MKKKTKKDVQDMSVKELKEQYEKYGIRLFLTFLFCFLVAWLCMEAAYYGIEHKIYWLTEVAIYALFLDAPVFTVLSVYYMCMTSKYSYGGVPSNFPG